MLQRASLAGPPRPARLGRVALVRAAAPAPQAATGAPLRVFAACRAILALDQNGNARRPSSACHRAIQRHRDQGPQRRLVPRREGAPALLAPTGAEPPARAGRKQRVVLGRLDCRSVRHLSRRPLELLRRKVGQHGEASARRRGALQQFGKGLDLFGRGERTRNHGRAVPGAAERLSAPPARRAACPRRGSRTLGRSARGASRLLANRGRAARPERLP
mmetsp:Transcript_6297/g.26155  ORF Transcript_6297/g.26155 Transcript_6297/m.26155 type:complete len:218 (+) Transcript_6297:4464-5117(+)